MSDTPPPIDEPTWLDEAYLKKIINTYTNDQLKDIKSFTKGTATTKGENYASAMHLITVDYTIINAPNVIQTESFIMKSRLDNELMSQIEEHFNVFHREAQVYTTIMNEAEKLLSSIGDDTIFGPKAIYVDDRVIVQENLKLKGYAIEDVKKGLDFEHCSLILKKLAKFHAVSMKLYKKNPDIFRHHLPSNITEHASPLHDLYINSIKSTIDYCKNNEQLSSYVTKLETFGEKIIPKMINVFSRNQADRFHVLNHGDVWVNNMMFYKDPNTGGVTDVLFVDYQEGFYGSPGIDWNYFMFSSWQSDVFENRREELIAIYHDTLSDTLHKLNFEQRIPTIDDVKRAILNKSFHGLSTATSLLPILINEHEELADPANFLLETEEAISNRRIICNNPKFGEKLQVFLKYFEENEIL